MTHPNRTFDWTGRNAMLAFVAERAFAHIFIASADRLYAVHAPVIVSEGNRLQFHVARRNRAAACLPGSPVLISVAGRDGYQSANWYASGDQVPTWHYEAVEIEGAARPLPEERLIDHLDRLTRLQENRHSPDRPWTREKMRAGQFEAMLAGVLGFEVDPTALRGTRKFNQHKSAEDHQATVAGQMAAGRPDIASALEEVREL